jgi:uncharacterized SAM-binding protein YcdF (DUF218 family)
MIRNRAATSPPRRGCLFHLFRFFILCLVLAGAVWLARVPLMTAAAGYLVEDDGVQHAELAVVLGGDEYGTRVLRGAELGRQRYVPQVLVSFPHHFGSCDSGVGFATAKGYPAGLFREFPNSAQSTREEVTAIDGLLRANGVRKILLVTSNYHTRRSAYLLRGIDPNLQVLAVPASDPNFTPYTWWKSREGRKTFILEWAKTVATHLGQ